MQRAHARRDLEWNVRVAFCMSLVKVALENDISHCLLHAALTLVAAHRAHLQGIEHVAHGYADVATELARHTLKMLAHSGIREF
ncbi:MAG TPA: hypothetical protein VKV73_32690 [Chloroflexota bacterium]|nr:hypothetical protein [Chloroflexota bacterium]